MMTAPTLSAGHRLSELLEGLAPVAAEQDVEIVGMAIDSRRIRPGELFLACAGTQGHGLQHVEAALAAGAAAVAWEKAPGVSPPSGAPLSRAAPMIAVDGLGRHAGAIASRFYGHPSADLQVIGVTGTDGKTSCSHFIAQALDEEDAPCGLIGTLGYGRYGHLQSGLHTTPDAITLQSELARLRDIGAKRVVMEVSSHALDQNRVGAVAMETAVLTNLGRDHLDYHGDLAAYAAAKRLLFRHPGLRHAVLNADDAFGRELLASIDGNVQPLLYGFGRSVDGEGVQFVRGSEPETDVGGLRMRIFSSWGAGELSSGLLGRFNAANLLAAAGVLLMAGISFERVLTRLAATRTVAGRMERVGGGAEQPLVVVDYAHTPQALEHVLTALRPHCQGALWCVFGAGGDRDRGKRPLMGEAVERLADHAVVTDDNPRHEDATQIVVDILAGMQDPDAAYVERDRARAIDLAIERARPGDVVLVAGKGHEAYQQIGDKRLPFNDREQVLAALGRPTP
ncbi:MAG: UDP-N-acetylmuramoyl-L-alanyl-D-glutamate--2,6-diaminopimelate ligase [Gammaproteobacteria bacterium]